MSRKPPALVTLLVLALASVGCGDDDGGGAAPEADTTTTVAEVTTTTAVDPFTVPDDPDDITVEYVEAVLTELERINGDALRLAMEEGVTPRVANLIESINSSEQAARQVNLLVDASVEDWAGLLRPAGDIRPVVNDLLVASADCIGVEVEQDFTLVSTSGGTVEIRIELARGESNDTGWVVALRHPLAGQTTPDEPCALP